MKRIVKWALAVGLASTAPQVAHADLILVGAPVSNNFSAWDSQANVPPSGTVFNFADEFSLSSAQTVTSISFSLFGFDNLKAPLRFALLDNLTSLSPLSAASLTTPPTNAIEDFVIPVNLSLAAGTYFIRLTTDGFFGWPAADATQFVTTAGTVADGIWEQNTLNNNWVFMGSGGNTSVFSSHPGVFSVLGPDNNGGGGGGTDVPEPGTLSILGLGLLGAGLIRRRKVSARNS